MSRGLFYPVGAPHTEEIGLAELPVSETLDPVVYGTVVAIWPFRPQELFADGGTVEERAAVRAELVAISGRDRRYRDRKNAKALVAEIRSHGVNLRLDSLEGRAVMDDPGRCPYRLLLEFVRYQQWIEDVLTREDAVRIRAENVHMHKTSDST